ncbi:uncharacterized protein DUF4231 [Streptomyces sp. 1114.5]|uniref:DUF4231 domain-containing protein n=1 Tax=unclassified Streptomyces TaxID=2593676 RepID=UPI000BCB719B|nr:MULTISPECIES: DUF4231 domain-containing protein [unclassified Streptomyces]RKT16384.1 uncharacterized protein DUF4231 [Streptomyces sp. 1114.5]SOB82554.1 Protein of unknown function [Streptomyces sp. 1331.2]
MVQQDPPGGVEAQLLPELFRTADKASLDGQRETLRWYRGLIAMLVIAALIGSFPGPEHDGDPDVWPLFSVAAFLVAGYFWSRLRRSNPQGRWYEARAAAESVKTLAWKYTVRARPFDGEAESADVDRGYLLQVEDVLRAFEDPEIVPPETVAEITPEMRRLRAEGLTARRTLYLRTRVEGQRTWYRSRAEACDSQAVSWGLGIAALIIIGAAAAVAQATGALQVHVFGVSSAAAASIIAWTQLKQLRPLATAYQLAARELENVGNQLSDLDVRAPDAEARWARLAAEAEDAVSREHTTWRARRAFPK